MKTNESTLDELFISAVSGDSTAYSKFYNLCVPLLKKYLVKWIRNDLDLEDICQEVMLKVHTNRAKFNGKKVLRWVFRIARNLTFDRLRAEKRRKSAILPNLEGVSTSSPESFIHARQVLSSLSDPERELIRLLSHSDFKYSKASVLLGVKASSLRMRVSRLRRTMQKELSTI